MAMRAELLAKLLDLQKKRQQQAYVDVKNIYRLGFPIEQYVPNTITTDQYKQITGKDYVDASTSTSAGASESTSTDTSQA